MSSFSEGGPMIDDCLTAPAPIAPTEIKPPVAVKRRLMSLDALRGFDMFWILGADGAIHALNRCFKTGFTGFLPTQFTHLDWEGFHFYDLISPLFLFIVGVSTLFSLTKHLETAGRTAALKRIFRRTALLLALGFLHG